LTTLKVIDKFSSNLSLALAILSTLPNVCTQ